MLESFHSIITAGGLAVILCLCLGGLMKSAFRRLAKQGVLFCLIGCGFLQSMASKPGPGPEPPEPTLTNTVEFVLDDCLVRTGGGELVQLVETGSGATAPEVMAYPGYKFTGWDRPFDVVTNDLTVTAQWEDVAPSKSEDWIGEIYVPTNGVGIPEGRIVVESGSKVTITVTGLPKGLVYDKKSESLVYNASQMKDGNYALVVSAKNANGYKNDKVVTFASEEHASRKDPLDWGESYYVGQTCSIACDEFVAQAKTDSLTLKGLPSGLKLVKYTDGAGLPSYRIEGTPTKVGRSTVTWTEKHTQAGAAAQYYMIVDGAPSKYVDVCDDDLPSGCKVTGSGVYDAGKKITLKATAAKGLVFAGWYRDAAFETPAEADVDYRNPTLTSTDVVRALDVYYPRFIELKDDFCGEIAIVGWDGESVPAGTVVVVSESLPAVTVSGLPIFLTFDKKTNALVFNETKAKGKDGDYAFVITAKNAGGYKNDRVVTFRYGDPEDVPEPWGTDYAVGQIVYEQADSNVTGLPTGLKCVKGTDEFGETAYFISGVPTKAGRFTVKADGEPYHLIVQGAPSQYVEVLTDGTDGCKVTGSGVVAAGATLKTSATAGKNCVFAGWYVWEEGEGASAKGEGPSAKGEGPRAKGEGKLVPFDNVYAAFLGKDGDWRLASQAWLCGTLDGTPTVPAKLVGCFTNKTDDALSAAAIAVLDEESNEIEEGGAWNVRIGDAAHTSFEDECSRVRIEIDSVSAPKLTIKGSVSGITVKNFGTHAELYYDPAGKTMPKPGEYVLTLTAVNQSKATATRTLTMRVPNLIAFAETGDDLLPNLDTSAEGHYAMTVGEDLLDTVDSFKPLEPLEGVTYASIAVSGLPAGVTCKNGVISGSPTKAGCYTMTVTVKYYLDGETKARTATATAFFRVEAIDPTCVGTFNGAFYDSEGAAAGTISATVSAAGKVTSCKLIDLKGKSTSLTFMEQTFEATEGYYLVSATDKDRAEYRFEIYPAEGGDEGILSLGGTLVVEKESGEELWTAEAQQNVWGDKDYQKSGLLPTLPSKGIAVSYEGEGDDLELVFKSAGAVTVARGKKSGSARFELETVRVVEGETVWTGVMTVNVPDGTDEGYCKTFAVTVTGEGAKLEIEVKQQ